jgi:hypothetical protein
MPSGSHGTRYTALEKSAMLFCFLLSPYIPLDRDEHRNGNVSILSPDTDPESTGYLVVVKKKNDVNILDGKYV